MRSLFCKFGQLLVMAMLCLVLLWGGDKALAYSPPVGIPDPGFGIDDVRPNRPVDWSSEIAGYYYVSYDTGTDTGRTYGTPAAPRKKIPNPVPAGSYVEVHGVYNTGGTIILRLAGTAGTWVANTSGPAWIVGQNADSRPDFQQKLVITGTYGYFDYTQTTGYGKYQIGSPTSGYPADHIVIRNSEATGSTSVVRSSVSVIGTSTDPVTNVVVYNSNFHDTGDISATYDQDAHITTVGSYCSNVWFLESTMHTGSGSGAQVGGDSDNYESCHHIYYGKNTVYNARQAGLAVKHASDIVFSENILHDMIDTRTLYTTSPSPSKGVGFQYAPNRLWILNNIIYGASYGIYAGSTSTPPPDWDIYIVGNVIHDITPPSTGLMSDNVYDPDNPWSDAAIMMAGGTNHYIVNNTIHDVVAGIYCPSSKTYYMENNIVSNLTRSDTYHVYMYSGDGADISTLKNSILFQDTGDERIRWGGSTVYTLQELQAATTAGDNSFNTDPMFTNAASGDLSITSSSPAKEAGLAPTALTLNVYDTFNALYGFDITNTSIDIDEAYSNTRDIGAIEYSAYEFTTQTEPSSPIGFSLIQNQSYTYDK